MVSIFLIWKADLNILQKSWETVGRLLKKQLPQESDWDNVFCVVFNFALEESLLVYAESAFV